MSRSHWTTAGLFLVAGSVIAFTGCQSMSPASRTQAGATFSNDPVKPLKAGQVADIQLGLGHSLEKQGDLEQAMAAYKEALRHDPKCAEAYLRLAILHDRQGQFNESEALYRGALALKPGDTEIFCDRGYSLYLQQCWAQAEMNLRQAIALQPRHNRAHNNLGLVLAHTGRIDECLAEFRKAGCTEADAQSNLAYVLALERHWNDAREHYEYALAMDANSPQAKRGLEELISLVSKANGTRPSSVPATALTSSALPLPTGN
ncbi:MAG: tetratricopeptide repeat protein [Gemmataceae bacterium]